MPKYKEKISFTTQRLLRFLKVFLSNKRGLVGLGILAFFVFLAAVGPYMTPYHPILSVNLGGRLAAPTWLKSLPGGEYLSENLEVVPNPGFQTPDTIKEWNFTSTPAGKGAFIRYEPSIGNPSKGYSGPGSIALTFRREKTTKVYGNVAVEFTRDFYYPYKGEPAKFQGAISLTAQGTGDVATVGKSISAILDVPAKIDVFIRAGNTTHFIWPVTDPIYFVYMPVVSGLRPITPTGEITTSFGSTWLSADLDSLWGGTRVRMFGSDSAAYAPSDVIFDKSIIPNTFTYGVRIIFQDTNINNKDKNVETVVYIDDFRMSVLGTSFGLLGTDYAGRDLFTQLVRGASLSLYVGILSSILSVVVGLVVGLVSGYLGKFADELIMRFTDIILIIPSLVLLIVLVSVIGASLNNLILLLALLGWPGFARTVRSQVLSLRERPFVEAARAIGSGKIHIMTRHILPNVMSLVYVTLATSVPGAIVAEAALSWLGFYWGSDVVSWGYMLREAQSAEAAGAIGNWWWVLPPGLCIAAIALSFILLGFALDEVLNPKLRMRR